MTTPKEEAERLARDILDCNDIEFCEMSASIQAVRIERLLKLIPLEQLIAVARAAKSIRTTPYIDLRKALYDLQQTGKIEL